MARDEDNPVTPIASNPSPNPRNEALIVSQASSSHPLDNNNNILAGDVTPSPHKQNSGLNTPSPQKPLNPEDFIISVAAKYSSQPLQYSDPDVWGVLTAISDSSRKRRQGMNMLLTREEHRIGRIVEDVRFQILSNQISGNHCRIYRKKVPAEENAEHPSKFNTYVFFLKDTSTNGTYLNWEKLTKHSPESKLQHGDIISFAAPPQHELAYAFVFREVLVSTSVPDGLSLKRKSEDVVYDNKRLRGIGIGASEGPLSLDDFRSLQRSNTELRKQLESHVTTIESLRSENRATIELHEIEKKELKESVSCSYSDQLKNLNDLVECKEKELSEASRNLAEQKHALEDLDERLGASVQSCTEANEIINSQKASISEFKALLDEERDQRREEREKAELDLKASIQRVQSEAQEEIKRLSETALKREKEQQEIINKLQESEKERCSLVEILRNKLEETRQKSVISDNKVRQLEAQVCEEQQANTHARKKIEELENEVRRLKKELEREKAAREEAWSKVSALELEINAAKRDLDFEKRKLRAARERIILRETQLRAFYSTTEEISVLFVKQQEQLKSMQRTLEDEENYDNISFDVDLNPNGNINKTSLLGRKEVILAEKAESGNSTRKQTENCDEASTSDTEKHECNTVNQDDNNNIVEETQEADFTSSVRNVANGAFGSDIDGINTEPIGTERVSETETLPEDGEAAALTIIPVDTQNASEDNDNETVKTGDLLTSEVAGSWACSTAPSAQVDEDSVRCEERDNNDVVPESESVVASDDDRRAIRNIFGDGGGSDTEDCSDNSDGKSDNAVMDIDDDDDDDDEATQADSVG